MKGGCLKVISNDSFFILGVLSLTEKYKTIDTSGVVVLDAGGSVVYIFDGGKLNSINMRDPLSAMLHCRSACLPRNTRLDEYHHRFCRRDGAVSRAVHLTSREQVVIIALCEMMTPQNIARKLNISSKTVSCYKRKALSKLGLKNLITLRTVFRSWQDILPTLLIKLRS